LPPLSVPVEPEEEPDSVVVDEQPADMPTVVMRPAIAETLASANNFLVTITRLLKPCSSGSPPSQRNLFGRLPARGDGVGKGARNLLADIHPVKDKCGAMTIVS
jgi:hypothetical protein